MNEDFKYWKKRSEDYEWMYKEQKYICDGYREITEEYLKRVKEKDIKIAMLMNERDSFYKIAQGNFDKTLDNKSTEFPDG